MVISHKTFQSLNLTRQKKQAQNTINLGILSSEMKMSLKRKNYVKWSIKAKIKPA